MQVTALQALADPVRFRIVEVLGGGERAVNEIVSLVDIHQSGVSRHLRILHDTGFVQVRSEGNRRLYSLRAEQFRELDEWMSQYRRLWEGRFDRMAWELDRRRRTRAAAKKEKNP